MSFHFGVELSSREDVCTLRLRPQLESVVEVFCLDERPLVLLPVWVILIFGNTHTAAFKELQNKVVVPLIFRNHFRHSVSHSKTVFLVLDVPTHQPHEDTAHGFEGSQFVLEVRVLLLRGKVAVELNHLDTLRSKQGLVCDHWKVVAGEPQGKLRSVGDCRLVQRTSGDFLAACKLFDFLLVQLAVLIALTHGDKAFAFESRKGRGSGFCVLLPVTPANHTDRGNLGVVPKHILNGVEEGTLAVASRFAVKDKHTLLVAHAKHGVAKRTLQEVCFVLVSLSDLLDELFPPLALHVSPDGVPEIGLHGDKIVPPCFPERKIFERICPVLTVDEVGVCVKVHRRDTKLTRSVLQNPVPHASIAHLIDKGGVALAGIIVRDFPAVENHEPHKVFDFLRDEDCALVLAPCPLEVGVPALMLSAITSFPVIKQTEKVCHTHFRPLKAGACFISPFRVIGFDNVHFLRQFFVHNDPAVTQFKKFSVTCHDCAHLLLQ